MAQRSRRYLGLVVLAALGLAACSSEGTADGGPAPSRIEADDAVAQDEATVEETRQSARRTGGTGAPPSSTPAAAHVHPVAPALVRLEATGQPYQAGEVGPRVESGEEEVTAFAVGLPASTTVTWCAGAPGGTCFTGAQ